MDTKWMLELNSADFKPTLPVSNTSTDKKYWIIDISEENEAT